MIFVYNTIVFFLKKFLRYKKHIKMEVNQTENIFGITGLHGLDIKIMSTLELIDIENIIDTNNYIRQLFIHEMFIIISTIIKDNNNFDLITFCHHLFWEQNFDVLSKLLGIANILSNENIDYNYLYEFLVDDILIFYLIEDSPEKSRNSYKNYFYDILFVNQQNIHEIDEEISEENNYKFHQEIENYTDFKKNLDDDIKLRLLGFLLAQNNMYLERFLNVVRNRFHIYYGEDKGKKIN